MLEPVSLYIDGAWRLGQGGDRRIENPATGEEIGRLTKASISDLNDAIFSSEKAFKLWSKVCALERSAKLREVAVQIRKRIEEISRAITLEQGKPLSEARLECEAAAGMFEWFAEEARRTYGRIIPARAEGLNQIVLREPVGPVAAFTPWNFPVSQTARKIAAGLAAGCTMIVKGPEETPSSVVLMVKAIHEALVPPGVVNLVYGTPDEISTHLITHPVIRKLSFTGSTAVGKHLASMAGRHMKRVTMELGGHAPVIVFDDADVAIASKLLVAAKYRNAGQDCVSPTRFLVHDTLFDSFAAMFIQGSKEQRVGDGQDPRTTMGPLTTHRRVEAMEEFVANALNLGAKILTGGKRIGNKGHFFEPTVLADVPKNARVMNDEPFGPIALVSRFQTFDEAIEEANRLPYGLAAYAYTRSAQTATRLTASIESGMVSINHHGLGLPETPFGGVKESGYGSEGGSEAMESYQVTKFISHMV